MLDRVRNLGTFAGILALDKWTCNADGRQAAFWRKLREKKYSASFIDQGYCFNAGEWTFPDFPLRGVYPRHEAGERVGVFRALVVADREAGRGCDLESGGRDTSGMVWRVLGGGGGAGVAGGREEGYSAGVDSGVSRVAAEAVSGVGK